jgi:hypothetical protein
VPLVASANPDQVPAQSALDERPLAETLHSLLVEFERFDALPARGVVGIHAATLSHDMTIGRLRPCLHGKTPITPRRSSQPAPYLTPPGWCARTWRCQTCWRSRLSLGVRAELGHAASLCALHRMPVSQLMSVRVGGPSVTVSAVLGHLGKPFEVTTTRVY